MHPCQSDIIIKSTNEDKVPYFNANIYTEDKKELGKVDEIFGAVKDYVSFVVLSNDSCFKPNQCNFTF